MHKALATCLLLACIVVLSCKKYNNTYLPGKWYFKAHYVSQGNGLGSWHAPSPGETFLKLNNNGTVETDVISLVDFTKYVISRDSITFYYSGYSFKVKYDITGKTLMLRPDCPERCDYRFEK